MDRNIKKTVTHFAEAWFVAAIGNVTWKTWLFKITSDTRNLLK